MPCHDNASGVSDALSAIRQQQRQLKKITYCSTNVVTLDTSHLLRSALNRSALKKRCTGSHDDVRCGVSDVVSAIRQQRRQLKKNLLP